MSNTDRHPECHMRTALGNCDPIGGFCTSVNESICEALHKIRRPRGEWIEDPINKNIMYCSNCKASYTKDFLREMSLYHEPKDMPDFCPNCGARMKGADDE